MELLDELESHHSGFVEIILRVLFSVLFILIFIVSAIAQKSSGVAIKQPINLYETYTFSRESSPYIRTGLYMSAPTFFIVYGFSTWGWRVDDGFTLNPETYRGEDAVHGGADKYGHLYSAYVIKRFTSFLFRASGSSGIIANFEGAIFSEIIMLGSEIGDGFSKGYGFDPYDVMFNNIGIIIGIIIDCSPVLDRIFSIQFEYVPSREMREDFDIVDNHDLPTDYGGTKYILAMKLSGIPYISLTPLRYMNVDLGYYSRGYDQRYERKKTKNVYLGISLNFSIVLGDLLPVGYTSSAFQTIFNYIHLPWDYETMRWKLSEAPNESYEE
jgi:hypothetical protein